MSDKQIETLEELINMIQRYSLLAYRLGFTSDHKKMVKGLKMMLKGFKLWQEGAMPAMDVLKENEKVKT